MAAPALEHRLRPRKTPRQARAAETRARILTAARQVFADHGYAAGTTNRIAEAAGLSVGSVYQYFPNKDAILVELVRAHVDHGTDVVLAAAEPYLTTRASDRDHAALVRAVVRAMVAVHADDRRLHRVLFEESPRPPSLLRELAEIEDHATAVLAQLLGEPPPGGVDSTLRARIVVVTVESLVHRFVASDRPIDIDRFVDEVTRLVTGYLAKDGSVGPGAST
jgi:AcrR family transcriptional regulator